MNTLPFFTETETSARAIARARVLSVDADGRIATSLLDETEERLDCEQLHTSDNALTLRPEDVVLVWRESEGRGIVLGRIGSTAPVAASKPAKPDELVIDAAKQLTLRCGDAAITLRDGKLLLQGGDIVSHAKRVNRIRGGSVAIN